MKKKIGKVIRSLLLVFLGVMIGITLGINHVENSKINTIQTYKDIQGLTYEYVVGDIKRGATILKCSPSSKEIEIPENIVCDEEVYPVRSIDLDSAFTNYSVLENIYVAQSNSYFSSVDGVLFNKDGAILFAYPKGRDETSYVVPDTVNSIEYKAFENCSSLTNIEIPKSVIKIGYRAFANCGNLKSIELPDLLSEIDEQAFAECMNLESFNIPSLVESIGEDAFFACENLKEVSIESGSYAQQYMQDNYPDINLNLVEE